MSHNPQILKYNTFLFHFPWRVLEMGYRLVITLATLVVVFLMVSCTNTSAPGGGSGGGGGGNPSARAISKGDVVRAVMANDRERLRLLISRGADINENVGDSENAITPIMAAIVNRRTEIALELLDNGASMSPTYFGYSAQAFALGVLGDSHQISTAIRGKR
jgi:hypothetical protein